MTDPKNNLHLFVSLSVLEELLQASIAGYNVSPHDGLHGSTPLKATEHSVRVDLMSITS